MTYYRKLKLELDHNNTDTYNDTVNNVLIDNSPSWHSKLPPKLKLKFNDITLYIYYTVWLNYHAIIKNNEKNNIYFSLNNERAKGSRVFTEGTLDLKQKNKLAHFLVTSGYEQVIPFIFGEIKNQTTTIEIEIRNDHYKRYELLKATLDITKTLDWIYRWEKIQKQKKYGIEIPDGSFKTLINGFIDKYNLKKILEHVNSLTSDKIYNLENYNEILKLNTIINNLNNKIFLGGIESIVDDVIKTAITLNINEVFFFGFLSVVCSCIGVISLLFLIGVIPGDPAFTILAGFGIFYLLSPAMLVNTNPYPAIDEQNNGAYENFRFFNESNDESVSDFQITEKDKEVLGNF